ncbi:hypothetical protein D3C85_404710 [compost metagenome]
MVRATTNRRDIVDEFKHRPFPASRPPRQNRYRRQPGRLLQPADAGASAARTAGRRRIAIGGGHRHLRQEPPHHRFRIADRHPHLARPAKHGFGRTGDRTGAPAAITELCPRHRRRRQRRRASGPAARPVARPDPGAGERQAPLHVGRRQRQRFAGPRFGARRPERHPAGRHRPRGSAARWRGGPVRFRCDCRRDQHHPEKRRGRRRRRSGLWPDAGTRRQAKIHQGFGRFRPGRRRLGARLGGSGGTRSDQPRRRRLPQSGRAALRQGQPALWRSGKQAGDDFPQQRIPHQRQYRLVRLRQLWQARYVGRRHLAHSLQRHRPAHADLSGRLLAAAKQHPDGPVHRHGLARRGGRLALGCQH